jgi:membrane protein implicated in regulation of membrane protease activity
MRALFWILRAVAVLALPLVGFSLWLDTHGRTATATVTGKDERIGIEHDPTGGWYLRRYLVLEVPELTSGFRPSVWVDSTEFDRIRVGDRVTVRYISCCPIYSRLASHSTRGAVWEAARELGSDPFLDWLALGSVALIIAARIGSFVVVATGGAWLVAAMVSLFPARPAKVATGVETTARVTGISLVDESPVRRVSRSYGSRSRPERLTVPYQIVQLRFVPVGRTDTVLAVDGVDAGSVPSLDFGAQLRVRYDPKAPREALLVDARRTFLQRNRFHFLFMVLGCVGIGTAMGMAWRLRGRRASPAT